MWVSRISSTILSRRILTTRPLLATASFPNQQVALRPVALDHQQRWAHNRGAKLGKHLETLDELAHEKSHQEASERHKKKKDKKRSKGTSAAGASTQELSTDIDAPMSLPDPISIKEEMIQHYDRLVEHLKGIRGGEPTPEIFERIMVDAYGSMTPLASVAQVVILSPSLASATCYDPTLTKAVSNAIRDKLELNPSIDEEGAVRIPIPRPSLETRQQLSAQVHQRAEACRQKVRNLRRAAMDVIKQGIAGKLDGVSKDDAFRVSQEMEHVTEEIVQKITQTEKDKQASILQV